MQKDPYAPGFIGRQIEDQVFEDESIDMADILRHELGDRSDAISSGNDEDETVPVIPPPAFLGIDMPNKTSSNITTYGHQMALANRIQEKLLWPDGLWDTNIWKPVFVHDGLMLPGSLVTLFDAGSSHDIYPLMTPALLPGVTARIDASTLQPRLLRSPNPHDYVQGMLIFGLTKAERKLINAHYHAHSKRKQPDLEVELVENDLRPHSFNTLGVAPPDKKRVHIRAYAWMCRKGKKADVLPDRTWTLEQFLEGRYEKQKQTVLRISETGKGDEDAEGFTGREVVEREIQAEKREDVVGGSGGGDWERAKRPTGW